MMDKTDQPQNQRVFSICQHIGFQQTDIICHSNEIRSDLLNSRTVIFIKTVSDGICQRNQRKNKIDNKNILIVKMDKSMLCEVSQIASKALGSSFVNEDILDNDINLCAKIDEEIVAYATTKFIDLDYLKKIIRDKKLQLDQEYEKIGYIDSIAVDENYSGYGIGTLLLKDTISKLREHKIGFAIMAGWINKDQVNIKKLAIKEGSKEEFIIEEFWKEDSLKFNFDCTTCGKPPCLCSAIIYTKKI